MSARFIAVNQITLDDVQMDVGEGIPWTGDFFRFGEWMKSTGVTKRFCVWNDTLFFTSDAMAGEMKPTAGRIGQVPTGKQPS